MTIVNRYRGWDIPTSTTNNSRLRDSDFGVSKTRDVVALNEANPAGVSNPYNSNMVNRFGASSNYATAQLQALQSMVTEAININGITVRYMPRKNLDVDSVYNEVSASSFAKGLQIDMYLESTSGFDGAGDTMSQYGIEFQEEVILKCSIPRFNELYGQYEGKDEAPRHKPLTGDLIVVPFGVSSVNDNQYIPKFFEILKVTTFRDGAFYQLGDNYQYQIRARLFELSNETFEWKPEVDNYIADLEEERIVLDSDTYTVNITDRDSEVVDPFADNHDLEVASQQTEITDLHGEVLHKEVPVMVKDYTAKAFGYGSILNSLDDI